MRTLLLTLCASIGWLSTSTAQLDPSQTVGFKQFQLGMTITQVNEIVRATAWEFNAIDSLRSDSVYLGREVSMILPSGADSSVRELLLVGCDINARGTLCHYAQDVILSFFRDTLYSIKIKSRRFARRPAYDFWQWTVTADSALHRRYGMPDRNNPEVYDWQWDRLGYSIPLPEGDGVQLSRWQPDWTEATGRQRIEVVLMGEVSGIHTEILMTNLGIRDRSEQWRLTEELRRIEEMELNRSIPSDF